MADTAATAAPPRKHTRPVEFAVEFGDKKNRNFVWPVDERLLRGRWSKDNLPGVTMDERFAHMPDLPGMSMVFSLASRSVVFFDPLADPKARRRLEKAQKIHEATFGDKPTPEKTVKVTDLSDDQIKSICYWTRRYLDARQLTVKSSKVPEMKDVEDMPGCIVFGIHDKSLVGGKLLDRPARAYVPMQHDGSDTDLDDEDDD